MTDRKRIQADEGTAPLVVRIGGVAKGFDPIGKKNDVGARDEPATQVALDLVELIFVVVGRALASMA
jgi:hypothetical protein